MGIRRIKALICCILLSMSAWSFKTNFLEVDFDRKYLIYDGKEYELVEVKNKVRRSWREVTYLCIDRELRAVAFRLFVTDEGDFIRLQKYTSNK